jgi:hypothetical protein
MMSADDVSDKGRNELDIQSLRVAVSSKSALKVRSSFLTVRMSMCYKEEARRRSER